jgi:hypothetical protein
MRNIIAIILFGLMSPYVFADATPGNSGAPGTSQEDQISYRCKFSGKATCAHCEDPKVKCWVEGTLCNEIGDLKNYRRCHGGRDPISIKCSDGFSLHSRDAAVEIDDNTLWINADERHKIATIRVEDFFGDHRYNDREFRRFAQLITSEKVGQANRFVGACEFRRGHDGLL